MKVLSSDPPTVCSAPPQCVPPDEACTSLDASMIWAMMQNKKTFTKPLAVIHQEVASKGVALGRLSQRMAAPGLLVKKFQCCKSKFSLYSEDKLRAVSNIRKEFC